MFNVFNVEGFSDVLNPQTGIFIFIEAILTKCCSKKKTPVKNTNKKVKSKTETGTSTIPISSKPQRIETLVQTEYPSGMSGITLQNHFSQTNIRIDASPDDVPLDVPLFSANSPLKKEPEDVKINPDLENFKQICQNWKNYEVIFKKRYPVIDRNFLWSNFWNKVILNSTTNSFLIYIIKVILSLIEKNKKYTLRTADLGPLQKI